VKEEIKKMFSGKEILRTWSIRDSQTLAHKNCVTNESARKHATIALKGYINAIITFII